MSLKIYDLKKTQTILNHTLYSWEYILALIEGIGKILLILIVMLLFIVVIQRSQFIWSNL